MGNKENLINDLLGKSTVKRRRAGIQARSVSFDVSEELIKALEIELHTKSWKTRSELIKTLGIIGCSDSEKILHEIVFAGGCEFDAIK